MKAKDRKPIEEISFLFGCKERHNVFNPEDVRELEAYTTELEQRIEAMYEKTTVTKRREKDEYWGYWETCDSCKSSMISESIFCPNCGKRVTRKKGR